MSTSNKKNAQAWIYNDPDTLTVALTKGIFTLAANSIDPVEMRFSEGYTKTAYAAGTAPVKRCELAAVPLTEGRSYNIEVSIPGYIDAAGNVVGFSWKGAYAASAADIASATTLAAAIVSFLGTTAPAAALSGKVSVAASTSRVDFTGASALNGDIFVQIENGVTTVTTAYVKPQGRPADIIDLLKEIGLTEGGTGTNVVDGKQYTVWKIHEYKHYRHATVNGAKIVTDRYTYVIVDNAATGYSTFETAIDKYLGGTIDATSAATVAADVARHIGRPNSITF